MKKILSVITSILFLTVVVYAVTTSSVTETKQYGSTMPGQMYFVRQAATESTNYLVWTNNESELWYPSKVEVSCPAGQASTTTLYRVTRISTAYYATNTIGTNEFGTTVTNYNQGLTNTVYEYLTNIICTVTNGAGSLGNGTAPNTIKDDYFQRNDMMYWVFEGTTRKFVRIIGYR